MDLTRGLLIAYAVAVALSPVTVRAQQFASNGSSTQSGNSNQSVVATSKPRKIVVDASLRNDPTATVVWIAYGLGLAMDHQNLDLERTAGLHVYVPTFDADLAARRNQIAIWNQLKAKDASVSNTYMAQLEEINKAGFLREYVWEYYRRSGWHEPAGLKLEQFDAWKHQQLPNLEPETHAHLAM